MSPSVNLDDYMLVLPTLPITLTNVYSIGLVVGAPLGTYRELDQLSYKWKRQATITPQESLPIASAAHLHSHIYKSREIDRHFKEVASPFLPRGEKRRKKSGRRKKGGG